MKLQHLLFGLLILINSGQAVSQTGTLVKDIWPGSSDGFAGYGNFGLPIGNKLVFSANDGKNGIELWVTDGYIPAQRH